MEFNMIKCQFEDGGTGYLRHVVMDVILANNKGEILLIKRSPKLIEGNKWATPGGFLSCDETIIEAVIRETQEETGCEIKNLQLFRINGNPHRKGEDRQNVDFIFVADLVSDNNQTDWETAEKRWFKLDQLPEDREFAFDHYDSIELYKKYLRKEINLPILDL